MRKGEKESADDKFWVENRNNKPAYPILWLACLSIDV